MKIFNPAEEEALRAIFKTLYEYRGARVIPLTEEEFVTLALKRVAVTRLELRITAIVEQ